jgi:diacylglycerol kinase family enzyme
LPLQWQARFSFIRYYPLVHVLICANPISGKGKGKYLARALKRQLTAAGYQTRVVTERPDPTQSPLPSDCPLDAIISVGGDGTLRAVAEMLYRSCPPGQNSADAIPPILVVPLGTANLMGKHLGLDWQAENFADHAVRAIQRRQVIHLDAAEANGNLFLLMAGVGIDAAIVHELDRIRTGPIDFLSYALPAALALKDYTYPALTVFADGKLVFPTAPAMAWVGNIAEYGTGFPILPRAKSDDGLLDLCVMPCSNRREALDLALRAAASEHLQVEGVLYRTARQIQITSPVPVPIQLDGDPAGHTPLDIHLLPIRMPFIVP